MIKDLVKKVEIESETVYLRKDFLGWRVVSPIKVDGKVNIQNLILGNKRTIVFTLVWLLIMTFILFGVNQMISSCKDMTKNPCKYIKIDCSIIKDSYDKINIPIIRGGDLNAG